MKHLARLALFALAAPASAQSLLAVHWDGAVYRIDVPSATITLVGDTGLVLVSGLDVAPDGLLYIYSVANGLSILDPLTFTTVPALNLGNGLFEGGLAFGPGGEGWFCNGGWAGSPELFEIGAGLTGVTQVGVIGGQGGDYNGLVQRNDGMLVGMDRVSNTLRVIDPSTAGIVQEFPLTPIVGATGGLTLDEESAFLVTGNSYSGSNELWSFDPFTGSHTFVMSLFPTVTGTGLGGLVRFDGGQLGTSLCSPANANSTGQPGVLSAQGTGVAGDTLTLIASALPPGEFGYFLASRSAAFIPNAGGSQGNLCLALPIARFSSTILSSGAAGSFALAVDTNAIPMTPPVAVQAGETWVFQAWYRDQNPGATSNFTDALQLTFN